ncbi:hypothetical protein HDU93_001046 [Gonapodya sp. JEL0774]|nr:hypothetical protein HDU93_001046 [Gonapodya sp. JEL0774]
MPSPFSLCDLPSEILLVIGEFLPFRLGLPTGALNRHLAELFRTPSAIATQALAHYPNPSRALFNEIKRSEIGASEVVAALCARTLVLDILNTPLPKDSRRRTPLSAAAQAGNIDVVRTLLSAGADIHAADGQALRFAVHASHPDIVHFLLDKGADIHVAGGRILADNVYSRSSSLEVLQLLLDRGADIHSRDDLALMAAASKGREECRG